MLPFLYVAVFLLLVACTTIERRAPEQADQIDATPALLTQSEIEALMHPIGNCWTLPVGIEDLEDIRVVQLRIQMRPDRTVEAVTIVDRERFGRDPEFRAVALSAARAVEQCSPLDLPPDKYELWRVINFSFYPEVDAPRS
jgi:hypothetical protein